MVHFTVSKQEKVLEIWLLLFFLFSTAGWLWEVLLTVCTTGQWVNRGLLHGPWLPVYGAGGVLFAAALTGLGRKSIAVPLAGAALGCAMEYATAWALETLYRRRWWDYSGLIGSVHGRVCLFSAVGFALAGWLTAWAAPGLLRRFARMRGDIRTALCRSVSLIFALDWTLSLLHPNMGAGISSLL